MSKPANAPSISPGDVCDFNRDDVTGARIIAVSKGRSVVSGRGLCVAAVSEASVSTVRCAPVPLPASTAAPLNAAAFASRGMQSASFTASRASLYLPPPSTIVCLKMHEPLVILCPITHKVAGGITREG